MWRFFHIKTDKYIDKYKIRKKEMKLTVTNQLITENQLRQALPAMKNVGTWCYILNQELPKYGITTPNRISAFLAQVAHESSNFNVLSENLNYSWQGLRKTFPRYFKTDEIAKQYHRQPEKIANRVYNDANRTNKLGNTQQGDGWRFRGRGLMQVTGRYNYESLAKELNMSTESLILHLTTPAGALQSALLFWQKNNLNELADTRQITVMTKRINGGTNGLTERINNFNRILKILNK